MPSTCLTNLANIYFEAVSPQQPLVDAVRRGQSMPSYPFNVSFMAPEIPDFIWAPLEDVSRLTFTPLQRTALVVAMNCYLEGRARQYATPGMKAVKEYYKRLYKHAKPLVNLLHLHMTNDRHDNERQIVLQEAAFSEFPFSMDRDRLTRDLDLLVLNLKAVVKNLHDQGQQGVPVATEQKTSIRWARGETLYMFAETAGELLVREIGCRT